MSLLSVEALDVRYGQFRAVRGVSFSIAKGEVVALIGANGAGKTTLLRAVAGAKRRASDMELSITGLGGDGEAGTRGSRRRGGGGLGFG